MIPTEAEARQTSRELAENMCTVDSAARLSAMTFSRQLICAAASKAEGCVGQTWLWGMMRHPKEVLQPRCSASLPPFIFSYVPLSEFLFGKCVPKLVPVQFGYPWAWMRPRCAPMYIGLPQQCRFLQPWFC